MSNKFEAFASFFNPVNRAKGSNASEQEQGVVSDLLPELKDNTPDKDLTKLKNTWLKNYDKYVTDNSIDKFQKESENYWLGKQFTPNGLDEERPIADNRIFKALETFLPQATRQNPEPLVTTPEVAKEENELAQEFAEITKNLLVDLSDVLRIKLKVKDATRHWAIYLIGVAQTVWDDKEGRLGVDIIRPQKVIFDPEGFVKQGEYTGDYLGIVRRKTAKQLITMFPDKSEEVKKHIKSKFLGTKVQFYEWWTDEKVFWTLGDVVLDKRKNPHWNEDEEEVVVDEFGVETVETVPALNHWNRPRMPFSFLTVFSLGRRPHDETSLILQNLANQDIVNKRTRQITKNVDDMNNGWIFDGNSFDQKQAARAIDQLRKGNGIVIPDGNMAGVQKVQGNPLPADVYNNLQDIRNELEGIFGTLGVSPQGLAGEETARGKILRREADTSRIGGGVSEYIEQFVDRIYNDMVQFIYVYYEKEELERSLGVEKAALYLKLKEFFRGKQLRVSVKEGSLIPKDPLTKRNEAIDLYGTGVMRPKDLFERLDEPDPEGLEQSLLEWKQIESGQAPMVGGVEPQQGEAGVVPPPPTEPTPAGDLLNQVPI